MRRKDLFALAIVTVVAAMLFIVITVITYFMSIRLGTNFKVGFPSVFYYQFLVDCEIQHGFDGGNFVKDAAIVWVVTLLVWGIFIKKK